MKIAACFSGNMRTYKKTFSNIKERLLNIYECDVFIDTWQDPNIDWDFIKKEYNPKVINIEKHRSFNDKYPNKHFTSQHTLSNINVISMYYKIQKCNELKINQEIISKKKYDCVIRIRPDGVLNKTFKLENNYHNNIFVNTSGPTNTWICDTFAHSSSKNMDLYSKTYSHLDEFYNKEKSLHPETMLRYCFNKYKLQPKFNDLKFGILRENNDIEGHDFTGPVEDFLKL